MADQNNYDDLETDYLEEETESGFLSLMSVVIAFIAVAVFIVLAWYAYQTGTDTTRPLEEMEVVYPDERAIREAPQDPGGWQFPNKDKTVYNIISGEESDVKVEKILPPTEEPVARPEIQTEMWIRDQLEEKIRVAKTEAERQLERAKKQRELEAATHKAVQESKQPTQKVAAAPVVAVKEEPVKAVEKLIAEAPAKVMAEQPFKPAASTPVKKVEIEKKPEVAKAPAPVKTAPVKVAEPVKVTTATLTPNRLQLGAFRSSEEAKRFWQKTMDKHGAIVKGKAMHIERADLGEKGVFYRVQLYPFASRDEAKTLCDKLSANGQSCFPVKR